MKVVAYCRYSSENQRDGYSIEAQRRAIADWADRDGHTVIKYYVDEAKTGTSDDRAAFQDMIADSKEQTFEAVIVHKLDRFARDRYDSAFYKKILKDNNVRLISVLEPLDDSPESVIMESILEGMAEYYSKNLSREVLKGKKVAAKQGLFGGGHVPVGLKVNEDKTYSIDEEWAPVILEIFQLYDGGLGETAIARILNDRGLRRPNGGKFYPYWISSVLTNKSYIGTHHWGVKDPVEVPGAFDAIIDYELWDRVQKRKSNVTQGKISPKYRGTEYLLTGYATCGYCGSHLHGFTSVTNRELKNGTTKTYTRQKYRCSKKNKVDKTDPTKRQKCEYKQIDRDHVERAVVTSIENVIFNETNLQVIVDAVRARLVARAKKKTGIEKIENEIAAIKNQMERLLDLYLEGSLDIPTYDSRKKDFEERLSFLNGELLKSKKINPEAITIDLLKHAISNFLSSAEAGSTEYKKMLISSFVENISVDNDTIDITFKFELPGLDDGIRYSCDRRVAPLREFNYARIQIYFYARYERNMFLQGHIYPLEVGMR